MAEPSKSKTVDLAALARATDVDRALSLLRQVLAKSDWTLDALEAHMRKHKSYISRVLNGEKPMTLDFIVALPDEIEAAWEAKRAEHFGLVVVNRVSGDDAIRSLVSGLVGVLTDRLPAKADRMAKADVVTAAPLAKAGER